MTCEWCEAPDGTPWRDDMSVCVTCAAGKVAFDADAVERYRRLMGLDRPASERLAIARRYRRLAPVIHRPART